MKMPSLSLLISFLEARGWIHQSTNDRFIRYRAPDVLGFTEPYILSIPANTKFTDFMDVLRRIISNIAALYSISLDDALQAVSSNDTIFSIRLVGEKSEDGTFPLVDFENLINTVLQAIENSGNFIIGNSLINEKQFPAVNAFVRGCRFLQTEKGSFVAKMKLPSEMFLKEPDLFNMDGIRSEEIGNRLHSMLDFITGRVFKNDPEITEQEFIARNFQLLSVDTFKSVGTILSKSQVDKIEFGFLKNNAQNVVVIEDFQREKVNSLLNYVSYLENSIQETVTVNSTGKIIEMKSKNPEGDRNFITVLGEIDDRPQKICLCLSNSDYQSAINAHGNRQDVTIVGTAKKLKTILRITELISFSVG